MCRWLGKGAPRSSEIVQLTRYGVLRVSIRRRCRTRATSPADRQVGVLWGATCSAERGKLPGATAEPRRRGQPASQASQASHPTWPCGSYLVLVVLVVGTKGTWGPVVLVVWRLRSVPCRSSVYPGTCFYTVSGRSRSCARWGSHLFIFIWPDSLCWISHDINDDAWIESRSRSIVLP